eukprot:PhF_6_TR11597/c0_g1_i1/m.18779
MDISQYPGSNFLRCRHWTVVICTFLVCLASRPQSGAYCRGVVDECVPDCISCYGGVRCGSVSQRALGFAPSVISCTVDGNGGFKKVLVCISLLTGCRIFDNIQH